MQLKLQAGGMQRRAHCPRRAPGRRALALATLLGVTSVRAEEQVDATYHYFGDSVGNSITSYVVDLQQGLPGRYTLGIHAMLDRVHLPPLPGLPGSRENVDAITTASRPVRSAVQSKQSYTKQREEVTASLGWHAADRRATLSGAYYISHESDFLGQQVAATMRRDWNAGSSAVALRTAFGFDRITPDEHVGGELVTHSRSTFDATGTWIQSLTPRLQTQLGLQFDTVRGFQSNPYRNVYAGGQPLPERHPTARQRGAVFGQIDRALGATASVSFGARYYADDWGIRAGTFDVLFNQYVGDHFIVRYRYRFHRQTAAAFYRDLYPTSDGIDGFRTADYKLQGFDSNLFGIKVSVPFTDTVSWLDGLLLDLKYERYFDSHSFAANVFETGVSWPF